MLGIENRIQSPDTESQPLTVSRRSFSVYLAMLIAWIATGCKTPQPTLEDTESQKAPSNLKYQEISKTQLDALLKEADIQGQRNLWIPGDPNDASFAMEERRIFPELKETMMLFRLPKGTKVPAFFDSTYFGEFDITSKKELNVQMEVKDPQGTISRYMFIFAAGSAKPLVENRQSVLRRQPIVEIISDNDLSFITVGDMRVKSTASFARDVPDNRYNLVVTRHIYDPTRKGVESAGLSLKDFLTDGQGRLLFVK